MKNEIPAFPLARHESILPDNHGMSLRDYFAAKAMQSIINDYRIHNPTDDFLDQFPDDEYYYESISEESYKIADAMLEAREK